jgi:cyclic beta-1,2-glucan synthetase
MSGFAVDTTLLKTSQTTRGISFAIRSRHQCRSQDFQGRRNPLSTTTPPQLDQPLRGEPFSLEHLATHAEQIATGHRLSERRHEDRRFIERFDSNHRFIAAAYQEITNAVHNGESIPSAAEWVIDNYHIIEEQLREIREDLPRQYYQELPKLEHGNWAGFPRVYDLAHELVVHTDSSLNQDLIVNFVEAYQRTTDLTSGEIWAVPIMLRLVLVENLRRLCSHVLMSRALRGQAAEISRQWLAEHSTAGGNPMPLDSPTLVVHLLDCLRESNPERAGVCLADVAQRFGQPHEAVDQLVRHEQQRQAADQVSVGNIITSMQLLSGLDWKNFFEQVSPVERILRQDPAQVYPGMDFSTRDQYRHEVEELAKRCRISETKVAATAIACANESDRREETDLRRRHVGFFLIDEGRAILEPQLGYHPGLSRWMNRFLRRHAELFYLGSVWWGTLLGVAAVVATVSLVTAHATSNAALWIAGLLALIPASDLAVALVNATVTHVLRPRALPKLEFVDRIPSRFQTLVVIPTLLTSEKGLRANLERLEIHYLANPEPGLQFALLTDFADAPAEEMPGDVPLLSQAQAGMQALNDRHAGSDGNRFLLLHRPRQWNPMQHVWMAWERKRGKLLELNRLLRGAHDTTFLDADKARGRLKGVKFVITLDADTRMPHGTAKQLIGTLAHPLNRSHFDPVRGRVTRGYGILQPRVSISLSSVGRTLFARFCANSPGLDPYCMAVSDVYQDLFGEGSYTGKGIYDVDAFTSAVDETFPENQILSHDLIEGCFARVGLVTDIELFDEFPTRYDADARRQHRWVRGDWQILPWLFSSVPTPSGWQPNHLSLVSRWKIFDNLRRSLVAPVICLGLLAAWLLLPATAMTATIAALIVLAAPLFVQSLSVLASWPQGVDWQRHLRDVCRDLFRTVVQCAFVVVFLPYRAGLMVDAVGRTLFRMLISRRHLLEWETADAAERRLKTDRWSSVREMGWVSVASLVILACLPAPAYPAAAPILLAWFVSPAIGHWISRPRKLAEGPLSGADRKLLRSIARKTWAFFEEFVVEADHWLPPDNFQEYPRDKVAHRISPTNAGLYIISALTARDFGYCGIHDLLEMLERNLDSLDKLDRYRGHFLNWYDSETLEPLSPRYASTADSGNLAASLIAAARGVQDVARGPLLSGHLPDGLEDAVALVEEALARFQPRGARLGGQALTELEASLAELRQMAQTAPGNLAGWQRLLARVQALGEDLATRFAKFQTDIGLRIPDLSQKMQLLSVQIAGWERDAAAFLPWLNPATAVSDAGEPAQDETAGGISWITDPSSRAAWNTLWHEVSSSLSVEKLSRFSEWGAPLVRTIREALVDRNGSSNAASQFDALAAALASAATQAGQCRQRLERLEQRYLALALAMDFTLTYNPARRLFSIGYNLDEARADRGHYDLLASESRLASLVAIAKGDVDHRHWFQLGRTLTEVEGTKSLLSWGGTMFEFLMPTLFARDYHDSLLDQSCRAAVHRQISYGKQSHVPWGISESAFSAQAANSDYHYQSFGVPGLGLKRGLAKDLVISPYSTALASMLEPALAAENFRALAADGAWGEWGFYDAVDYTPSRVPPGERRVVVYNYMAHHHGMTLAALANCLLDHRLQRRFQEQPLIRSAELLLQEKVPVSVLEFQPQSDETATPPPLTETPEPVSRRITTADTVVPHTHLLSNGQYTVMLSNAGGGFSTCRGLAISRWRADATRDQWGQFIYLRDVESGRLWSAGHLPVGLAADDYEVTYSVDKAEIRRFDGDLETHLEVTVAPENNSEIRQVTIKNHGHRPITIEVTSFVEIALAPAAADLAHPAFSKLFVETEFLPDHRALLARRRPREAAQPPLWAVHVSALPAAAEPTVEYETDRLKFLGRGRTPAAPAALERGASLTGTTGPVLDPIFSLRHRVRVGPDEAASLSFITAFADTREEALSLADQYHDPRVVQRTFELAWASSQIELQRLKASPASIQLYQRLASAVIFPDPAWRAPADVLKSNRQGQTSLWRHGISGDDPIVLLRLSQPDQRGLLREVLFAHEFWHAHAFKVDLIVLNDHPAGYFDSFHEQLLDLIQTTIQYPMNKSGGVYLLRGAHLAPEDTVLLQATAAICLSGEGGPLARQMEAAAARRPRPNPRGARISPPPPARRPLARSTPAPQSTLAFGNSQGGFSADGRSYVIRLNQGESPPAPWSNCVANEQFGFLVTESGGGFTWAGNSRENKLTAWSNDPVSDPPAEIVYVRDESTGAVWNPTPLPIRDGGEYVIEHGHGYSQFTHLAHDIESELLLSIAPRDSVKFACLKLRNRAQKPRTVSVIYYAELVLGVTREQTQMHVWTSIDAATKAVVARNPYQEDYPDQSVFLHTVGGSDAVTGDRAGFIGRNRSYERPAALERPQLAGTTGAGFDPCAAVQKRVTIAPDQEVEVIFLFGQGDSPEQAAEIVGRYPGATEVHAAIDETRGFWNQTLTAIEIKTPNAAMDLLVNHWLLYQVLSCRVWGRSAFYQAGGAFGFRDQLQDVMALVYSLPDAARAHILRAASRQFEEGDVQHWWHPPRGRGVRTRFSDDFLWLALAASHYVTVTGDEAILDERVPYLQSAPLEPGEEERYDLPAQSSLVEDLCAHCVRAVEHAFRFGPHGIPLMGSGDWNDGMNKVGALGQGESVWMAWFLAVVLRRFAPLLESRGDRDRAVSYRARADALVQAVEQSAWDGDWYLRAYFDDGTPLGSARNEECRIDSLVQSWSVIAGADPARTTRAMQAVDEQLVREADKLVLLFTPPFDKSSLNPGYIKGYLPGIRENGGQYTHAAAWVVQAAALQGRGSRAVALFDLLNPILHSDSAERGELYRVEPYVVAADVYSQPPHMGRGGWTWYTGSASWMYRVVVESILGISIAGDRLQISPSIPADWPGFEAVLRRPEGTWRVVVKNPAGVEFGVRRLVVDGQETRGHQAQIAADGKDHLIEVEMG